MFGREYPNTTNIGIEKPLPGPEAPSEDLQSPVDMQKALQDTLTDASDLPGEVFQDGEPTETALPPELVSYIDELDPQEISGMAEPDIVDFCLTHGSGEQEDAHLEKIDEELRASSEAYVSDLEMFLSASPDYGVPSFVHSGYNARPQHHASGWELEGWLKVAAKHLPGAESEAMDDIVACIIANFDPEQFELAAEGVSTYNAYEVVEARNLLHKRAGELANTTARQLCSYEVNADTIQDFIDCSFMQTFGKDLDHTTLQARVLELNGEQASPDYADLLAKVEQNITATGQYGYAIADRIDWLLRRDPQAITRLIAEKPQIARMAYPVARELVQNTETEGIVEVRNAALAVVENQAKSDVATYAEFVKNSFDVTGTFDSTRIGTLKTLLEETGDAGPLVYQMLYVNLPIEEVAALTERHSASLADSETRAICVQRFAAEGCLDKAYELARTTQAIDSAKSILHPINNLLAIYDETGDEAAFAEAQGRLHEAQRDKSFIYPTDLHKIAARTFKAARRHGHTVRAQEAEAAMEPYYSHAYSDVRDRSLGCRLRLALDDGDLPTAKDFAARLYASREQSNDTFDKDRSTDALLHVLQACVQAGDTESAVELVQAYFATDNPHYTLKYAVSILRKEPLAYMPPLYASHLHAIADFKDR